MQGRGLIDLAEPGSWNEDLRREMAQKWRVADPTNDAGSFESLSRQDALVWLVSLGITSMEVSSSVTDEEMKEKLRYALWDAQRIDNIFHEKTYEDSRDLDIGDLPSWDEWTKERKELKTLKLGTFRMDGFKEAKRLDSYVYRHFQGSASTQSENENNTMSNLSPLLGSAWVGAKSIMSMAALDITREKHEEYPFATFFSQDASGKASGLLIMEILDVKKCKWPEPNESLMKMLKRSNMIKFGWSEDGPLAPMLHTPTFPLVLVRYSYHEGRPADGLQFVTHLENQLKKSMPQATPKQIRKKLEFHLASGVKVHEAHLRMFAWLLSFNNSLIHKEYTSEMQNHWNGISREVARETSISFFVPCLRLRWRVMEEIETGVPITLKGQVCASCRKEANKLMCGKCRSVYYCNSTCSRSHWQNHKYHCNYSKRCFEGQASRLGSFYIPLKSFIDMVPEHGFTVEQETHKYCGCTPLGECPKNEYGDERFMVKTLQPRSMITPLGPTVIVFNRRRSLCVRGGVPFVESAIKDKGIRVPFDRLGYAQYLDVLVQHATHGRQYLYLWARRCGD